LNAVPESFTSTGIGICSQPSLVVIDYNRVTGYSVTSEQALAVEQTLLSEKAEIHADLPNPEIPAPSSGENQNEEEEGVVLTFAQLQELITAGRVDCIPNNKIIRGGLNVRCSLCVSYHLILTAIQEGQPSMSTATVRKKPWEVAVPESTASQSMA
jgi:hypothetical protein